MRVFVLTDGEYSDYHIIGVFSKRKFAEDMIKQFDGDSPEILELVVDERIVPDGMRLFTFNMFKDGDSDSINDFKRPHGKYGFSVLFQYCKNLFFHGIPASYNGKWHVQHKLRRL